MKMSHLKELSLYGASVFLLKGISLITLPLMASYLTPAEIGHLELLGITCSFFGLIVALAMHENLYRFIGTINNFKVRKTKAAELYHASLLLSLGLSALLTLIYWLQPFEFTAINRPQLALMALVLCYEAPLAISLAWLRLHNQAKLFFNLCAISVTAQLVLLTLVLVYYPDVTLIFALNIVCTLAQFIYLHFYLKFAFILPKIRQLATYLGYSTPLMLSALIAFGLSGAERWLIAAITDLETLGMYAIAAKFALAVGILLQPFLMWWMPKRFATLESQGVQSVVDITLKGIVLLCVLTVSTAWLSQIFITLALPQSYHAAIGFIAATIAIMLFKELVELTNLGILYSKSTAKLLYINLAATIIALGVCLGFVELGMTAILLGLLTGQMCRFGLTFIISQQLYYLNYPTTKILAFIAITLLLLLSSLYQQSVTTSVMMLLLQPLTLIALAIGFKFIHRLSFANITHLWQSALRKPL